MLTLRSAFTIHNSTVAAWGPDKRQSFIRRKERSMSLLPAITEALLASSSDGMPNGYSMGLQAKHDMSELAFLSLLQAMPPMNLASNLHANAWSHV